MGNLPRCDKWFELHSELNFQRYGRDIKGYEEYLKQPFVVKQRDFPKAELVEEFGPYFFGAGQASWLFAYAIMREASEIGLWGIEAVDIYASQKYEIQHFAQVAADRGIEVIVPDGCTLLAPRPFYGFESNKTH